MKVIVVLLAGCFCAAAVRGQQLEAFKPMPGHIYEMHVGHEEVVNQDKADILPNLQAAADVWTQSMGGMVSFIHTDGGDAYYSADHDGLNTVRWHDTGENTWAARNYKWFDDEYWRVREMDIVFNVCDCFCWLYCPSDQCDAERYHYPYGYTHELGHMALMDCAYCDIDITVMRSPAIGGCAIHSLGSWDAEYAAAAFQGIYDDTNEPENDYFASAYFLGELDFDENDVVGNDDADGLYGRQDYDVFKFVVTPHDDPDLMLEVGVHPGNYNLSAGIYDAGYQYVGFLYANGGWGTWSAPATPGDYYVVVNKTDFGDIGEDTYLLVADLYRPYTGVEDVGAAPGALTVTGSTIYVHAPGEVSIYDVGGRRVRSFLVERPRSVLLGGLGSGVFFARWRQGRHVENEKCFVIR